jgi:hypothetical protein
VRHDSLSAHALAEILIGRQDDDLVEGVRPARGCSCQRVVGLELDHRPDDDAESPQRLLGELELRQQIGRYSLTGLVSHEELVAEGLDDVVEGGTHMRDVGLAQQRQRRTDQPAHGSHRPSLRRMLVRKREVGAEELVGSVEQVQLHLHPSVTSNPSTVCPAAVACIGFYRG